MFGWLKRIYDNGDPYAASANGGLMLECRPGYPHGRKHGEVLYGLGGMGDASLCLRCGWETYGRIWPRESIRHVVAPDDWPAIEEARKIGIENH
jgi:hypothetical protein